MVEQNLSNVHGAWFPLVVILLRLPWQRSVDLPPSLPLKTRVQTHVQWDCAPDDSQGIGWKDSQKWGTRSDSEWQK